MPDVSLDSSVDDHLSSARLPIVDISSYLEDGATQEDKEATQRSLDSACREFGKSSQSRRQVSELRANVDQVSSTLQVMDSSPTTSSLY
jgi:hypothetical protein